MTECLGGKLVGKERGGGWEQTEGRAKPTVFPWKHWSKQASAHVLRHRQRKGQEAH